MVGAAASSASSTGVAPLRRRASLWLSLVESSIPYRRLCDADGWRVAAPPLQGPTPEESARVGVARFYRLVAPPGTGVS